MRFAGTVAASRLIRGSDDFNRTTSTSFGLGSMTTTLGVRNWSSRQYHWYADGSRAVADLSVNGSNNQATVAYIPGLDSNSYTASVNTFGPGTGIAFGLITDNEWYAAVSTVTAVNNPYQCGCQVGCNTCQYQTGSTTTPNTCYFCDGFTWGYDYTPARCSNGTGVVAQCFGCCCTSQPGCNGSVTGSYIAGSATPRCNTGQSATYCGSTTTPTYDTGANCSACGTYQYGCTTCDSWSYYYKFRLLKNTGGTITDATTELSLSGPPAGITVEVNGATVVAKAYQDSAMTTTVGTLTYTNSTPFNSAKAGIVVVPTTLQSTSLDNFTIQA